MVQPERRRRRQRHSSSGEGTSGESSGTAEAIQTDDPDAEAAPARGGDDSPTRAEERDGERGLRGLVGSGSSQLSVGAALRARDAARPTEADLAEAEETLVLVRRHWVPREELPRLGGR